jgi:hypothetical protein
VRLEEASLTRLNMPRGGARPGAGRKRTRLPKVDKKDTGFAGRVLARIGELGIEGVATPEDYALWLLKWDKRGEAFRDLLNREYGKAPQQIKLSGEIDVYSEMSDEELLAKFDALQKDLRDAIKKGHK